MPSKTCDEGQDGSYECDDLRVVIEHVHPREPEGKEECAVLVGGVEFQFVIRERPYLVTQATEMATMMEVLDDHVARWDL
jgi:hypothetical protein